MNYDLAKQLEDAGFPQEGAGKRVAPADKLIVRRDDFVYAPTLEELIEACGPIKLSIEDTGSLWIATCELQDDAMELLDTSGLTPAEAIARLWLALHSKRYAGHETHAGEN